MSIRAVILDFYGTLAESSALTPSWEAIVAEMGHTLDPSAAFRFWNEGIDGAEHDAHSRSRDHYVAWQRERLRAMLADSGIPAHDHDVLVERIHAATAQSSVSAYDEVAAVMDALRTRGLALAICSNWDWDLHEAVDAAGLDGAADVVVSSAWVGARKPHARIYAHTLERLGIGPDEALFVGDTWSCDVEGPRAVGLQPVYLRRPHFGVDRTAPPDHFRHGDVHRASDLHAVLDLL